LKQAPTFPPESQQAQWHAAYFSQFNGAVNGRNSVNAQHARICKAAQYPPVIQHVNGKFHHWMVYTTHKNGDDLGMVYEIAFTT